ncbi:hypothetical protein [Sphingobacterium sp. BIGb0165]|uniref:hypothetical protein n=1 Tax=Sphingobacterium sp. BIGb0165 TaxID=2940615 RepID=UPI0021699BF7|nr:hypothetical protein [Sphingobacterium sp. BIGb0165]MCS4227726.1 hypothetical protein [Sphingobacterium sp. BIGb0165]
MEKIILQVKESCAADWGKMTAQEQGRFCSKCEKVVVDFSEMSDQEIVDQIKKSNKGLCGRFYEDQLLRELDASVSFAKNPVWRNRWSGIAAGLMLIGSLSFHIAQAQTATIVQGTTAQSKEKGVKPAGKQIKPNDHGISRTMGEVIVVQSKEKDAGKSAGKKIDSNHRVNNKQVSSGQDSSKVKIAGKIVCASGGDSMMGTNVTIGNYHTQADEKGNFELWVPQSLLNKNQELRAEKIGYRTVVIPLKKGAKTAINKPIEMEVRPMIMGKIAAPMRSEDIPTMNKY